MIHSSLSGAEHPLLASILIPEAKTPDHALIEETARAFVEERVLPHMRELEAHDEALLKALYREAGELGLAAVDVPEAYGGLEMDALAVLLVTEMLGEAGGFGVSFNIHSGVGTQPILFFGTEAQRSRFVPELAAGRMIGAYALTEPNAGSDALRARTRARWEASRGVYVLNGEKQWISNARVADVFIVFAQLEGSGFTAFIVERGTPGLSVGPEEHKMGIHASPTASVIFDEVAVPADHLLGAAGEGHRVALSVLNLARHKMAVYALGQSRRAIRLALAYAKTRRQFGRPIADFPLIREKLAQMMLIHYIAESTAYRTGGELHDVKQALVSTFGDRGTAEAGPSGGGGAARVRAAGERLSRHIAACALNKVLATEAQAFVVDEAVQIHGGYGYMADYEVERLYRDARITRIFEGTNEINRLAQVRDVLKRGASGDAGTGSSGNVGTRTALRTIWPSSATAEAACAGSRRRPTFREGMRAGELRKAVERAEAALYAGTRRFLEMLADAEARLGNDLLETQMVVRRLADVQTALYALESTIARTIHAAGLQKGPAAAVGGPLLELAADWASRTVRRNMDEIARHLGPGAPDARHGRDDAAADDVDVIAQAARVAEYMLDTSREG